MESLFPDSQLNPLREPVMKRRDFVISSGAALAALAMPQVGTLQAQGAKEVVFNGAGGSWQDNVRKAWLDTFTAKTGIKVTDTFPFDIGKLSTMVRTKTVQWDVTDCPAAFVTVAINRDLVEAIDYTLVDKSTLPPENYGDKYVAYGIFSSNIVYDKRRIPGPDVPKSWKDYWDLKRFPGPRSFRNEPPIALEAALLADGVPADKLYPLDLDRAFRKLDEIKKDVRWWPSAQQSVQLIADGEVAMGVTFSSRAVTARAQGVPLEVVWNQGIMARVRFVVPKGASNKDNAMRLVNFIIQPEQQARFAMLNNSAPANPKAFELINPAIAPDLPSFTANREKMFMLDELGYWGKNSEAVFKRFNSWLVA
jgi:putative spermidine/putrescine transport system substrate-binding protein